MSNSNENQIPASRLRRGLLPFYVFGLGLFLLLVGPSEARGQIKVTLLGTGCPPPVMNRFGPSTLVEAGDRKFLFDAGRGALQRLAQLRVAWQDVQGVFLTIEYDGHSVVLSGDTRECRCPRPRGVCSGDYRAARPLSGARRLDHRFSYNGRTGGAGVRTVEAKPCGLFHVCLPTAREQDLITPTRKNYDGPLELGEDLMVVEVGAKITVRRPAR